jgi:hypothetical protein
LEIIPILLSEPAQAAQDILSLVGECGNAKEILLVTQELLERMRSVYDSDVSEGVMNIPCQLVRLIDLYSSCMIDQNFADKDPANSVYRHPSPATSQKTSISHTAMVVIRSPVLN